MRRERNFSNEDKAKRFAETLKSNKVELHTFTDGFGDRCYKVVWEAEKPSEIYVGDIVPFIEEAGFRVIKSKIWESYGKAEVVIAGGIKELEKATETFRGIKITDTETHGGKTITDNTGKYDLQISIRA